MPLSVFHERAWLSRVWTHAWEWPVHAHCSTRAATTAFATAQTLLDAATASTQAPSARNGMDDGGCALMLPSRR